MRKQTFIITRKKTRNHLFINHPTSDRVRQSSTDFFQGTFGNHTGTSEAASQGLEQVSG